MDEPRITPSRWYYVLAGVVCYTGLALFVLLIYKSISVLGSRLPQVVVPGETELNLREPGHYTIFYEYHSVVGDKAYSTEENLSGLTCTVSSKADKSKIALLPPWGSETYEFGGRAGRSVWEFTIDKPGLYLLSASYPEGRQGPEVVLAVGKDFMANLFKTIASAMALMFGTMAATVAIVVVTLVKRNKCKKRGAMQRPGSMYAPPGY